MFLVLVFISTVFAQKYWTIPTSFGNVRGRRIISYGNETGYAFQGVPFASPPLGQLRFKSPTDPKPWNGTLDTLRYRDACLQPKQPTRPDEVPSAEDCLYLNVFSSKKCLNEGKCPVLVYIYGGGGVQGTATRFPAESIVNNFANEDRNIVFVSIQYRLGMPGWLNLNPEVSHSADSNLAIRDTLFSLNWVQKEIGQFGGDPRRVTAMGQSAGGQMLHEIVFAGRSDGLFQQIIVLSAPFYGDVNNKFSQKWAQKLGCAQGKEDFKDTAAIEKVLSCLRSKTQDEILDMQNMFNSEVEDIYGIWVDGPGGVFSFEKGDDLFERPAPKLRAMIGTTTGEIRDTWQLVDETTRQVKMDLLEVVCSHVAFERNYERPEGYIKACMNRYRDPSKAVFFNDEPTFFYSSGKFADRYSHSEDVYVYSYGYQQRKPSPNDSIMINPGPSHSSDLGFLLGRIHPEFTEKDRKVEKIHSGMFANFVKSGDPSYGSTKWMPWDRQKRNYMKIDFDDNLNLAGMADDYYGDLRKYMEEILPRDAGLSHPLSNLPPEMDIYIQNHMVYSLVSNGTMYPTSWVKNPEIRRVIKEIWDSHVKQLRSLRIPSPVEKRTDYSELFMMIVGLLLAMVMGSILTRTYYQWRQRKSYELIFGEDIHYHKA